MTSNITVNSTIGVVKPAIILLLVSFIFIPEKWFNITSILNFNYNL